MLSSFVTSGRFTRHELHEYVQPVCEAESAAATANPATRALEAAHALAFRSGLGSSIFVSENCSISHDDVRAYAESVFGAPSNVAVLGTGIDPSVLQKLVEKSLGNALGVKTAGAGAAKMAESAPSRYFGGETRIEAHGALETVFVGFGATGSASPDLAALAAHLDPTPSLKWSQGLSPIASSIPTGTSVKAVYLPYSDATLVGFLVQGRNTDDIKMAGKAAVEALKAAGKVEGDELRKAVAKAKFAAASSIDGRDGFVSVLGSKVLAGSQASLDGTLSAFEKVDASSFSKVHTSISIHSSPFSFPFLLLIIIGY